MNIIFINGFLKRYLEIMMWYINYFCFFRFRNVGFVILILKFEECYYKFDEKC